MNEITVYCDQHNTPWHYGTFTHGADGWTFAPYSPASGNTRWLINDQVVDGPTADARAHYMLTHTCRGRKQDTRFSEKTLHPILDSIEAAGVHQITVQLLNEAARRHLTRQTRRK